MTTENNHGHHPVDEPKATGAHPTRLIFASQPSPLPVGKPATWTLTIADNASGRPIEKVAADHGKPIHLIVVSSDLAWFNHIHPDDNGNGEFTVTTVLPHAGTYKLYADYTTEGGAYDVPQRAIATGGEQAMPTMAQLVVDSVGSDGWMTKQAVAAPEGMPDTKGGPQYEVALMPMPGKLETGEDAMLHFQVRDKEGDPVTDLEPYLGALGHAVILSADTRTYIHAHPMGGEMHGMSHRMPASNTGHGEGHGHPAPTAGGPDIVFHANFPEPGLYKVWGQFQHRGKIITAAFVVDVAPKSA